MSGEPIGKLNAVNAYRLHEATRVLGGNPNPPAKVENVVVLFAGRYAPDESGALFKKSFAARWRGFSSRLRSPSRRSRLAKTLVPGP